MEFKTDGIYRLKPAGSVSSSGGQRNAISAGETLIAQVEQKQGGSVLPRDQAGAFFGASVYAEPGFNQGDALELAAAESEGDLPQRVIDVSGGDGGDTGNLRELSGALAALKSNASLDPKAALFLSQNGIAVSPENITELMKMARGKGAGALLFSLLSVMLTARRGPDKPDVPDADAGRAVGPEAEADEARSGASGAAGGAESKEGKRPSADGIIKGLLEMFIRPGEQTGAQIKAAVSETPHRLALIKELLKDGGEKETLDFAGRAEKQMLLASEIKRFDYLQIPFAINAEFGTAELFVQKRTGAKAGEAERETLILLCVETRMTGRAEILIRAGKTGMDIEFRLEKTGADRKISENGQALYKTMRETGYEIRSLKITRLSERTTVLNFERLIEAPKNQGGIDLKV